MVHNTQAQICLVQVLLDSLGLVLSAQVFQVSRVS